MVVQPTSPIIARMRLTITMAILFIGSLLLMPSLPGKKPMLLKNRLVRFPLLSNHGLSFKPHKKVTRGVSLRWLLVRLRASGGLLWLWGGSIPPPFG